ncbi:MAG TPA: hypothetical protein VFT98_22900, partial [Myxococcota bacterium]|nr:hypothetical protein [Myxococcota bacterium]
MNQRDAARTRARAQRALLAAALLAAPARAEQPPPPAPSAWFAARGPHIEAVSSAGGDDAGALALQLERALAAASRLLDADPSLLPPVTAISLTAADGYAYLRPLSGAPAFLHVAPERATLVLDGALREQSLTAAQHSLTHLLAASDPRPRPLWLEEGGAELVSTARVTGDALELGRPPRARLEWFALATLHPLKRVLSARETLRWSQHAREGLAAESWALLHFLRSGDRAGFPARADRLASYLALVNGGMPPERACAEAFGLEAAALEAELLRFLSFGEPPRERIALASLGAPGALPAEPLVPARRDALLGELALSLGRGAWAPAERWLRSAALYDPASKARLAQLRALRGDERAQLEPLLAEAELASAAGGADAASLSALALARLALATRAHPPDAD